MKLYSRRQMVVGVVAGALVTSILVFGAALLITRNGAPRSVGTAAESPRQSVDGKASGAVAEAPNGTAVSVAALPANTLSLGTGGFDIDETQNIAIYEKYNQSVVNITTEVVNINWFLEPVPQSGGSGSGSIIDSRGYVLTNYHVVKGTYKLFVNMADGTQYEATLVGADSQNDLAVLKFSPPAGIKLLPVPFGTSKGLKVGQKVLAIGNPFGLERTLTQGIISGLGRPIQNDETTILQNMIQTDASINPGNSGGPLLNTRGEMIGINTMIYSPSGGSVGIGFAIPVDTAVRIVPELIKEGRVRRGWIDMDAIQLFPALVSYMKQSGHGSPVDKGLLVSEIKEGSNAAKAGLKGGDTSVRYGQTTFKIGGDIITKVDGQSVASIADLYTALEDNKPGGKVQVEFYRGAKKETISVVLTERAQGQ